MPIRRTATIAALFLWSLFDLCAADDVISRLDTDRNGVIDLQEAETAASEVFRALDQDKGDTLDGTELAGRLDPLR